MKKIIVPILIALFVLSGCAPHAGGPREQTGTLIGAGTGALLGAQVGSGRGRLAAVAIGHPCRGLDWGHCRTAWGTNPPSFTQKPFLTGLPP